MGKTYRRHVSARTVKRPRQKDDLKSNKQRRPNERAALRREYR